MPTVKLTEKTVAKLKAPTASGKQEIAWDDTLRGFGVLISGSTTAKSYIVQRTLPGGKTRRITVAPCNVLGLAEARSGAEEVLAKFYQGVDPKAPRGAANTLREALDGYLQANKRLSDASRRFYRKVIERHLQDWLDLPLRSIDVTMVQDRHAGIAETVAASGRSKGHAMANSVMMALGIVFNHAAEAEPALINPTRRLRRQWFHVPRRTRMVKADDMPVFYRVVQGVDNAVHRDLITLLLFSGLRLNEAAKLSWDEIDFAAGVIRIPAQRMKARRPHVLPMNDVVRDLLVARRAIGRDKVVFLGGSNLKRTFAQIAEKTGITVSAHDLRRTFLTVAESCDVSHHALKTLVAHSTGGDVTSGYVQMSAERLRETSQRVADRLKQLCGVEAPAGVNIRKIVT